LPDILIKNAVIRLVLVGDKVMKLSTKTRYATRAALELALNYGKGPLQIKIIADRQEISVKYLEQLMAILKTGGFIRSVRGARGGYVLAKSPNEIKLSELFSFIEGPVVTTECVEDENSCARAAECVTRQIWSEVQDAVMGVLEALTLQDLVERTKNNMIASYQI
jgi:Rrf2 family protein